MSNIRFIVQGSPDTAADTAYELQQYLETAWQVQVEVEATSVDKSVCGAAEANSKNAGFDPSLPAYLSLNFTVEYDVNPQFIL